MYRDMDTTHYSDVSKSNPSAFYGALSGSVCFPMPLMYNPMNSYPFMSTPFLPMHHPMLSNHAGLQDSHLLSGGDLLNSGQLSNKTDDLSSRALAFLQSRYQSMGKCFLPPPPRKSMMSKYSVAPPSLPDSDKLGYGTQGDSGTPVSLTATSPPTSAGYPEKECYLSSPSTEIEEPDSSGKCSTDVVEQKVIPRWTCDSSQPPMCPICGRTLSLQDLTDHYHMELDRLNELMRKKEWLSQEENSDQQMDSLRLQSYHDVEKRCPEFRKETYLRVRANRINRLGGCGSRAKRQCFDDSKHAWKLHRTGHLCSPKQENMTDEGQVQSGHQSMLMLELTVQQLAHRAEARSDLVQDSFAAENRSNPVYQPQAHQSGGPEDYHEEQNKSGELADSSCSGFNNLETSSAGFGESGRRQRTESRSDDHPCSTVDIKCHVCLRWTRSSSKKKRKFDSDASTSEDSYKKPVVSVCCWHVHCETCWLKSLGSKRVCPQCETITSPGDLRRIHL